VSASAASSASEPLGAPSPVAVWSMLPDTSCCSPEKNEPSGPSALASSGLSKPPTTSPVVSAFAGAPSAEAGASPEEGSAGGSLGEASLGSPSWSIFMGLGCLV
jgi:hypothetical protein